MSSEPLFLDVSSIAMVNIWLSLPCSRHEIYWEVGELGAKCLELMTPHEKK